MFSSGGLFSTVDPQKDKKTENINEAPKLPSESTEQSKPKQTGLFGNLPADPPKSVNSGNGGLFGKVSTDQSKPGSGGLFGNPSTDQSKPGLFGGLPATQSKPLFGNTSTDQSKPVTGSLFGKTEDRSSPSLFTGSNKGSDQTKKDGEDAITVSK